MAKFPGLRQAYGRTWTQMQVVRLYTLVAVTDLTACLAVKIARESPSSHGEQSGGGFKVPVLSSETGEWYRLSP